MVEQSLEGELLIIQKRHCYQEIGLIIFDFLLYNKQIDTIHIFLFKQKDLLLLIKTSFDISFIFQLILFFTPVSELIIILMLLRLL